MCSSEKHFLGISRMLRQRPSHGLNAILYSECTDGGEHRDRRRRQPTGEKERIYRSPKRIAKTRNTEVATRRDPDLSEISDIH